MWIRLLARHLGVMLAVVVLGGLLGATLVRLAPGFAVDPLELDPRLSESSLAALRQSRDADRTTLSFYATYLRGLLKGDLGRSRTFDWSVADLLRERAPVTLRSAGFGLAAGWLVGITLALAIVQWRAPAADLVSTLVSGAFLCVPAALLALVFLHAGGSVPLALAAVVFPRVFRYVRNLLGQAASLSHVMTARARGIGNTAILFRHVLRPALPQVVSLAGVSVSMVLGAAVPMEVICDSPGIGQLAWQAAMGRDLPLLLNLTLLVTIITLAANALSDLANHAWGALPR